MVRSLRYVLLVVVLALVGGACGGGTDTDGDRAAATTTTTTAEAKAATKAATDDGIEVVDGGKEPRRELRLALHEGDTFRSVMVMKLGIAMTLGGEAVPSTTTPPVRILMTGRIEKVADGEAHYRYTMDELGIVPTERVDPAVADATNKALAAMKGLSGEGVVDELGHAKDASVDTSKVTDPTMKSTLDSFTSQISNLTVPFPADAVGLGATWEARREAVLNGIKTQTTATYHLVARAGDTYELDVTQAVTAPKGPIDFPGLPPGATAEIVSYRQDNKGHVKGDLRRVVPTSTRITGGGPIEMRFTEAGRPEPQTLVQTLTLDVSLEDA